MIRFLNCSPHLSSLGQDIRRFCCMFRAVFMGSIIRESAGKLRRTILHQCELITFGFHYVRDRSLTFPWFLDFWDPCEPLFMDLNIQNYETIFKVCFETWYLGIYFLKFRKGWGSTDWNLCLCGSKTIGFNDCVGQNGNPTWWHLSKISESLKYFDNLET